MWSVAEMKHNYPHVHTLFDFVSEAEDRQRVIESYRRLSLTVDRDLDPADADLAQLAIGAMLEKLGVISPPIPRPRVH